MSFKMPNIAMKCSRRFFFKSPTQPPLKWTKAGMEIFLTSAKIISMWNMKILNTSAEVVSKADIKY